MRTVFKQITLACCLTGCLLCLQSHGSEARADRSTQQALSLDAHPVAGARQFASYCAQCHGAQGGGRSDSAIPSLARQRFTYIVRQLANFSNDERDDSTMHRVIMNPTLRQPQTWVDIAAYVDHLPTPAAISLGDGTRLGLGRGIFHEQCASCHLSDGGGDVDGYVPSLRNQNYAYLLAQLHKIGAGARHNMDDSLVLFMKSFSEADMRATADYLSRLRGSGRSHQVMRNDGVVVN